MSLHDFKTIFYIYIGVSNAWFLYHQISQPLILCFVHCLFEGENSSAAVKSLVTSL